MFGVFLLAALAAEPSMSAPPPTLTTTEVQREVVTEGPLATVKALWRAGRWVIVGNCVASGDPDWVALAPLVAPGTDAGTSEGLSIALADAFPKAPDAVLAVVTGHGGGSLNPRRVCRAPFIEDEPEHRRAYLEAALEALDRPMPAVERANQHACLARLRLVPRPARPW